MKKVKFILPMMAIIFAVAGVFATGNADRVLLFPEVSLQTASPCNPAGYCTNNGEGTCKLTSTNQTYYLKQIPVSCAIAASGTWRENPE